MFDVINEGINSMPLGWRIWGNWMILINMASLLFIRLREAQFVLAAWIENAAGITLMAQLMGYARLLGIVHVVFWTPLAVYLFVRLRTIERGTWLARYLAVLLATITVSLAIDYVDVARYALGERADLRPGVTAADDQSG